MAVIFFAFLIAQLFQPCFTQEVPEGKLLAVQVIHRHGSRVPDFINQNTETFWRNIGPPGRFSAQGRREMESLGNRMREQYVAQERILPEIWQQKALYVRASSARYARVLMSAKSAMSRLYSGMPIPIFSDDALDDTLLYPMETCPAYVASYPRKLASLNAFFQTQYPDLLEDIQENTGWTGLTPTALIYNITDNLHSERMHNHIMDPIFLRHYTLLSYLQELILQALYGVDLDDDEAMKMGTLASEFAREVANNFQRTLDGSDVKMYWYSCHNEVLGSLWNGMGLGFLRFEDGAAAILELRELDDGSHNVNMYYAYITDDLTNYEWTEHPIACPDVDLECNFEDFYNFLMELNPPATHLRQQPTEKPAPRYGKYHKKPEGYKKLHYTLTESQKNDREKRKIRGREGGGCCYVGEGFYEARCDEYLDHETWTRNVCFQYRKFCPGIACDEGQVVDIRTWQCVPFEEVV